MPANITTPTALALAGAAAVALYPLVRPIIHDLSFLLTPNVNFRRKVPKRAQGIPSDPLYVALGSSFAAGPTVGEPVRDAVGFAQGTMGYPFQLCDKLGIDKDTEFVNASSSGALLSEVPQTQLQYLGPNTRLVTITAGGNDVQYTRDTMMAYTHHQLHSWLIKKCMRSLRKLVPVHERDFTELHTNFNHVLSEIRRISPKATIVVATYVSVLPGDRELYPLTLAETQLLYQVGQELSSVTKHSVADQDGQVLLVDMASHSADHHAAAPDPWSVGFNFNEGFIVHPNLRGHSETANAIYKQLDLTSIKP